MAIEGAIFAVGTIDKLRLFFRKSVKNMKAVGKLKQTKLKRWESNITELKNLKK